MSYAKIERPQTGAPKHKDQEIVRTAIIAELDAANLYQAQIDNLDNPLAKKVIQHIKLEEKEHLAELHCLLDIMDLEQADKNMNIDPSVCIVNHKVIPKM